MTSIATLCATKPAAGAGFPIGYGTWRLAVQLAVPNTAGANVWGAGQWGTFVWSDDWAWYDLSSRLAGLSTDRGTDSPADRYRVGTANITLSNDDGLLAPWADMTYPWLAEGSVVRVVLHDPSGTYTGDWWPLFTGAVETVNEPFVAATTASRYINVALVDSLADLAAIVDTPRPPAGAGEGAGGRIQRLLDASSWRWPTSLGYAGPFGVAPTMQATTMAANRLAEAYLTADSAGMALLSDTTGAAKLDLLPSSATYDTPIRVPGGALNSRVAFGERRLTIPHLSGAGYTRVEVLPWASCDITRDDDATVSDVSMARAGGATTVVVNGGTRAGRRAIARTDLICESDGTVADVAQFTYNRLALATQRCTLNVNAFTDRDDASPQLPLALMRLDIGLNVDVWREYNLTPAAAGRIFRVFVLGVSHRIEVLTGGTVRWDAALNGTVLNHYAEGTVDANYQFPYGP